TRSEKKIIDIPYPVVRISNKTYKYEKKSSVSDVLYNVPGLFLQNRYGNHDVRISMRGFGSRSNSGIRGVRILLDGIPESEPDGQTRIEGIDFNSIGHIEIVRGNASSLYTNAPGGVINFFNDIEFTESHFVQFNNFSEFGLRENGLKTAIKGDNYKFLLTYQYHNYSGFRAHSEDFWNILNMVYTTNPNPSAKLLITGYFVDGLIRLPGSLTKAEFEKDPYQAARTEVDFDIKRISTKGRIGIRYEQSLDANKDNVFEATGYLAEKYFERTSRGLYRIMNRYVVGGNLKYVNKSEIFGRTNEFVLGGDLFYQRGPIEFYNNIGGKRSDILLGLNDEAIGNSALFFQNTFPLITDKMSLLITGRYEKVYFDQKNQLLQSQNSYRGFEAFTPKFAINYKLSPRIALYASGGLSFDSPAGNELDNYPLSSKPSELLNPDLEPQKSVFFEGGIKGSWLPETKGLLSYLFFEATAYNYIIDDEIVPFEINGEFFFRNSAKTNRFGIELGVETATFFGIGAQLSYSYSDFIYKTYLAEAITFSPQGDIVVTTSDYSNNRVPSVPVHNFVFSLSYEKRLLDNLNSYIKATTIYASSQFTDDANSDEAAGYNIINATAGFDLIFNRFNVLFNFGVTNLLDERYAAFLNINSSSKRFYEAGGPRSFFAGISFGLALP
ncbi:MAG: TonB-dependent receptor, partial [Ignavibacteriaceae bacterium]|nr:TonB-dependent receptor [Ignavibacteriaceae bacterium]